MSELTDSEGVVLAVGDRVRRGDEFEGVVLSLRLTPGGALPVQADDGDVRSARPERLVVVRPVVKVTYELDGRSVESEIPVDEARYYAESLGKWSGPSMGIHNRHADALRRLLHPEAEVPSDA